MPEIKALVVGGGITGTSAAIVLARAGVDVNLVERQQEWRALGHGITMTGPACRALDRIGLLEECLAEGWGVTHREICDITGTLQHSIPYPSLLGPGRPALLGMMRPTLHNILTTAATEAGVTAWTGTEPESIVDTGDDVEVVLSDGTTHRYDLVIGADGVHSWCRGELFGEIQPTFQHQGTFRTVLPRPADITGVRLFHGHPDVFPGFTPTGDTTMYMFCVMPTREPIWYEEADLRRLMREALTDFGGSVAEAREQITDANTIDYRLFESLLLPPPWNRGRIIVLGDAAHTTTPHLAAGAAMCLEDAIVLGAEFAADDDVPAVLARVSERRYDRCRFVVESSAQISYWQTHPDPSNDPTAFMIEATEVIAGPF